MRLFSLLSRRRDSSLKILCLLGDRDDRETMDAAAKRNRWEVRFAANPVETERALRDAEISILFIDRDLAGTAWRELLSDFASYAPKTCIILVSRRIDSSLWNDVVHSGGYETLTKPMKEADIGRAVRMAQNWAATVRK